MRAHRRIIAIAPTVRRLRRLGMLTAVALSGGCFAISADPACPVELLVGDAGPVSANERDPGGIPSYLWEVFPTDAGTFGNAAAANTTFTAQRAGPATIRLTASDGLFQVVADCTTQIIEGPVEVALSASPSTAESGDAVTLVCTSTGATPAASLVIQQTDGPTIELINLGPGSARFTAADAGTLTFDCVGETAGGLGGDPATVVVTVNEAAAEPDDGGGGRSGDGRR